MSEQSKGAWVAERVAQVREARRRQGHQLTALQEAIVSSIAASDPKYVPSAREELASITDAIREHGKWSAQEEWRISTWFESEIAKTQQNSAAWYHTTVACDGQVLSCRCPSIEKAFAFMRFYQALIVAQFYSVGPPWADNRVFEP